MTTKKYRHSEKETTMSRYIIDSTYIEKKQEQYRPPCPTEENPWGAKGRKEEMTATHCKEPVPGKAQNCVRQHISEEGKK